jgi:glycosyltransferase involved in cell wall biosynthesis
MNGTDNDAPSRRRVLVDGSSITCRMKGVGRYAYHLAKQLDQRLGERFEIIVALGSSEAPTFPKEFRGSCLKIAPASEIELGLRIFPQLVRTIAPAAFVRPADTIGRHCGVPMMTVCHDINPLIWAAQPRRALRRQAIDAIWERLRRQALRSSELVICNSEFVRDAAVKMFRLDPNKVTMAPCGVDESLIAAADRADRGAIRAEMASQFSADSYMFTFATGDEREGYTYLPALWRSIKHAGYTGALVIAGVNQEKPYAAALRASFASTSGEDRIIWLPFIQESEIDRLAGLYSAADFYLELSRHEGFGMQLAEAMACGTACASTGCGALNEIGGGYPLEIGDDLETAAHAIVQTWRDKTHLADADARIEHARGFTWDKAGEKAAHFILTHTSSRADVRSWPL